MPAIFINKRSITQGTAERVDRRRFAFPLGFSERRILLLAGDLLALSLALWGALYVRRVSIGLWGLNLVWWLVLWVIWGILSTILEGYDLRLAANAGRSTVQMAGAAGLTSAIYLVIPIISAPLVRSRLSWFLFCLFAMALVGGWRLAYARLLRQPAFVRRALIVGAGWSGQEMVRALRDAGVSDVEVVGFVDDNPDLRGKDRQGKMVLGSSADLLSLVEAHHVDDLVLAITNWQSICSSLREALMHCWERGIPVTPMPLYYEQVLGAFPLDHLGQNVFALLASGGCGRLWLAIRRGMDIIIGVSGLAIMACLLPILALAIRLDSRGPVFYSQVRVGQGGRPFILRKFRSMVPNAEPQGAVWAAPNDDRTTRVGRFMRRVRLDELPQFWNLLNGTMTLIGPRPERPEFVKMLEEHIPYYAIRHAIKPGLTGWAQVRYGYGSSVEDAKRKLEYDLYYLKHQGPLLDGIILLHTLRVILRMQGH